MFDDIFTRPPDVSEEEGEYKSYYTEGTCHSFRWRNLSLNRELLVSFVYPNSGQWFATLYLIVGADGEPLEDGCGEALAYLIDSYQVRIDSWAWLNDGPLPKSNLNFISTIKPTPQMIRKLIMKSKMANLAYDLGLKAEDLAEAVEEIHADRAEKINNDGIEAQIEFLHSDYCDGNPDVMKALLQKLVKERQAD